ncbi:MAG: class I SAM-dependent methyltransferase [Candidatus Omnitrophica bacterium]|nr:class I SAM-dependent methyltransferase [Candidatus Omnitrophota bacterium]
MDNKDHIKIRKNDRETLFERLSRYIFESLHNYRTFGIYRSYWWFRGRKELILALLASFKLPRHILCLDAGCGTGDDLGGLEQYGKFLAIDFSRKAVSQIPENRMQADIIQLPLASEAFDLIICLDVLEHIQEHEKAVKELTRVLKTGGYIVFSVPAHPFLYSTHDRFLGHVRRYSRKSFLRLFSGIKLKRVRLTHWNFFAFLPIAIIRIIRKVVFWQIQGRPLSDIDKLPYGLNWILFRLLRLENFLIMKINICLPWGTSLFGIFRKEHAE